MTVPPKASAPGPGWYPDPAGSGRLQWWNGSAWTGQFSAPQFPAAPAQHLVAPRRRISDRAPVYNPYIWTIVALPLVSLILLMFWNPVFRLRTVGTRQVQIIDPASIFTAPYFLLVATGFVAYGVSALLAYLDWDRLRKDGVVRPFHWAWVFLSRELYVIGRSVIVHEVAPRRGLAPVCATIGVILLTVVLTGLKMSAIAATLANQAATI
ncbi:DUF2510 domain-containing protein [Arthrobacter sp. ES3-54]|uniref:DUF2510 domain-containing protein n=1 Tax=Arthrobacter sp. ES3-54 TaxID=1502991 RepID=UPI002404E371|nr:DUF2510 domain-containing protein [Arthrobacter sp. ES3-54]MDF9749040.1 hypothetical protein [Arthrobacter sp. ES3-54]